MRHFGSSAKEYITGINWQQVGPLKAQGNGAGLLKVSAE
jgi:hypothetical protein